jgi:TnpA family transposase
MNRASCPSLLSNAVLVYNALRIASVARAVFHGQRGELRQRYREGQEDQLGALGLVMNALALWNTLYMEAVLKQ